jgi:antitoxin (DNA-binding transcriptional repressor) of toxin-antitoxin stability system
MPIRRRLELSVAEARLRFQQLVRVTGLTGQVTVVVDGGRPVAAIVPPGDVLGPAPPAAAAAAAGPAPPAAADAAGPAPPAADAAAAGWMRRIEKVREDVRRQHAGRIRELSQALDEAWRLLDEARPPGTDRAADALRAMHADLRHTQ